MIVVKIIYTYNCCQVIPFPLCELQSKWIAGLLSNRIKLPSEGEMIEDINAFYSTLEVSGTPKRYTHNLGRSQVKRFDSNAALSAAIVVFFT